MRSVRVTIVAAEKESVSYVLRVSVALVIQHVKRMRCIVIFGLSLCMTFLHYLINGTIFRKVLLNIKHVFSFSPQLTPETFFILRRIQ